MALVLCVEQLLPFLIYFRPLNWFNLYLIIVSIKFADLRNWTGYIWVGSNHSVHCATADALNICTLAKLCSSNRNDKFVFISGSRSLRVFHHRSETLFISNVYIMALSWPTRKKSIFSRCDATAIATTTTTTILYVQQSCLVQRMPDSKNRPKTLKLSVQIFNS